MTRYAEWMRRWVLGPAIAAGIGCGSGDGGAMRAAQDAAAGPGAGSTKFRVVLGGGPFPGTYEVASDPCLSGVQKAGAWNATWSADLSEKGKISAVLTGVDPRPTVPGAEATAAVTFGESEDQVMYEVLKPVATVTDRGSTATLSFTGTARTVNYADGSFGEGGEVEITVECGAVLRP